MLGSVRRSILNLAFHLLYHQLAFTYDLVASGVSFGQWKAGGRTSLSRIWGRRVLELGHGPGHLLVTLARSGRRQPIGIDLSPQMSRIAQRRIRREKLAIPLVRCRVQALPFQSGVFDTAVAAFPTEYIVEPRTLREVHRVTASRGRLVIVAGAQLIGRQPSARFIDWLYRITGQAEPMPEGHESIFEQVGMPARIEMEQVGRSNVTLVIADKEDRG